VIPLWIPPDAVGGKSVIGGDSEWTLDAGGLTGTIGALSTALRQATASPRFFRSLNQWTASFMRYAIVAEALGQVKRVWVLNHLLLIQRIAEEQRIADDGNPYLALVYDEMRRKSWAHRAERRDSSLDLLKESALKDEHIFQAAKQRLVQVLSSSGVLSNQGAASSLLQKQTEAASALTARAELATKALEKQSSQFGRREQAMRAPDAFGDSPMNARQKKTAKFFDKLKSKQQQRQPGQGQSSGSKGGSNQGSGKVMPWQKAWHKGGQGQGRSKGGKGGGKW
jgi:hypothetical protein